MKKTLQEVRQEKKSANKECLLSKSLRGLLNIILLGKPESHHKTHASELSYLRRERVWEIVLLQISWVSGWRLLLGVLTLWMSSLPPGSKVGICSQRKSSCKEMQCWPLEVQLVHIKVIRAGGHGQGTKEKLIGKVNGQVNIQPPQNYLKLTYARFTSKDIES